jgi:hypothetical protein
MSLFKNFSLMQDDYLRTDHVDVQMSHFRQCHATPSCTSRSALHILVSSSPEWKHLISNKPWCCIRFDSELWGEDSAVGCNVTTSWVVQTVQIMIIIDEMWTGKEVGDISYYNDVCHTEMGKSMKNLRRYSRCYGKVWNDHQSNSRKTGYGLSQLA